MDTPTSIPTMAETDIGDQVAVPEGTGGIYRCSEGRRRLAGHALELLKIAIEAAPEPDLKGMPPIRLPKSSLYDKWSPDRQKEDRPTSWHELQCGRTVVPLRLCIIPDRDDSGMVWVREFNLSFPRGTDDKDIHRTLIRRFQDLESHYERGILADEDKETWEKVRKVVDRDQLFEKRIKSLPPRRARGQVVRDDTDRISVIWPSGADDHIAPSALAHLETFDSGEWFEANIIEDSAGRILDFGGVIPTSPPPDLPTEEILDRMKQYWDGQER